MLCLLILVCQVIQTYSFIHQLNIPVFKTMKAFSNIEYSDEEVNSKIKVEQIKIAQLLFKESTNKILESYKKVNWIVDEDTSEMEVESSSDLRSKIEMTDKLKSAEAEAYEKAFVLAKMNILREINVKSNAKSNAPETDTNQKTEINSATVTNTTTSVTTNDSTNQKKGIVFDAGLIIAFPLMIITLFLFLFFPIIGPKLAGSLPPPPSSF
jgi:hypothetical protein